MRKVACCLSWVLCARVLSGCGSTAPRVEVEPVSFVHQDEWAIKGGFAALADRRIFATMAFLNAAGYDEELAGFEMHPARVLVRELVRKNLEQCPDKVEAWKAYYKGHRAGIFAYKSFALALSPDHPFRRVVPDEKLGYRWTAELFRDLPDILNDFWKAAKLDEVWTRVKPAYCEEVRRYDLEKMEREMTFLWAYLRMPRRDTQVMVLVPDLLDHHLGAMGAGYGGYYYSVENQGAGTYGLSIHEYLHSAINPLVEARYPACQAKLDAYYALGKDGPGSKDYRHPVTFAFECLVRALDRRIRSKLEADPKWTHLCEQQVASDTKEGLVLTQPFYDLLESYEESGQPFDEYLPSLLEKLPAP